ncbi:ricin B lectin domain-containing protein [Absidia repens]|uniref:Ricin B lectin domain-containing protein n=1 Tax=Absidia repens TaxID=90262 RepID=A0A1X2I977_9FUNG|nr:ricin B lectin domain-containing protein [Absidia repens]
MSFPSGWFFIESKCEHKMVLDVPFDSAKQVAKIVVMPKKDNCATQLWRYEAGYIINKNSQLVLDVQGGVLESDKQLIQYKRKMTEDAHNQRWHYREDGLIYPQVDPNLVLDIRGNWTKPGTVVLLYERKFTENENQLWTLVPADGTSVTTSNQVDVYQDGDTTYSNSNSSVSYAL